MPLETQDIRRLYRNAALYLGPFNMFAVTALSMRPSELDEILSDAFFSEWIRKHAASENLVEEMEKEIRERTLETEFRKLAIGGLFMQPEVADWEKRIDTGDVKAINALDRYFSLLNERNRQYADEVEAEAVGSLSRRLLRMKLVIDNSREIAGYEWALVASPSVVRNMLGGAFAKRIDGYWRITDNLKDLDISQRALTALQRPESALVDYEGIFEAMLRELDDARNTEAATHRTALAEASERLEQARNEGRSRDNQLTQVRGELEAAQARLAALSDIEGVRNACRAVQAENAKLAADAEASLKLAEDAEQTAAKAVEDAKGLKAQLYQLQQKSGSAAVSSTASPSDYRAGLEELGLPYQLLQAIVEGGFRRGAGRRDEDSISKATMQRLNGNKKLADEYKSAMRKLVQMGAVVEYTGGRLGLNPKTEHLPLPLQQYFAEALEARG